MPAQLIIGQQGATGPQGATGARGYAGVPGHDGEDGAPGLRGLKGLRGARGAMGVPGHNGEDGDAPVMPLIGAGLGRSQGVFPNLIYVDNGIKFPATEVASSDGNVLDDYEEGTFTPRIDGTTAAGVGTYTFQVAYYTKIGNRCFFQIRVAWTAHTGTGNMIVEGLPFTSIGTMGVACSLDWSTLTFGSTPSARIGQFGTSIVLSATASGAAATALAIDTAAVLFVSGHYYLA